MSALIDLVVGTTLGLSPLAGATGLRISTVSDYYDLGSHSWPVSTDSAEAQLWFDRGLIWTYGFNHEEAVHCFENAIEADPRCAMAHWGVAYASGPNYNKTWEDFGATLTDCLAVTNEATAAAIEFAADATTAERSLIAALPHRYPSTEPLEDCSIWNDEYANAMRTAYGEHPDNLDVVALFADALMNRTPWLLWDLPTGEPAEGADTAEARVALERAMQDPAAWDHPGVLHMYVHLMEMSPTPEAAMRAGDRLRNLVPDSGHLRHMPTHIDVLCGQYHNVVEWNQAAIRADLDFYEDRGGMNVYTLYRAHNYHFLIYGAMFAGQSKVAIEAADSMLATIPDGLLRMEAPPMADRLESLFSMRMHALIRFGMWEEILATELPEEADLFSMTTAVIRYARGVAYAATSRVDEALAERELFKGAVALVPETRRLFNNTCEDVLAVASAMLDGEIEYRRGNYDEAFAHLRKSIELDDSLAYAEPWGWMQPSRHAYGALMLEQGHIEEAEAVYRADLGLDNSLARAFQHPDNVWSLHGFHECLVRLGKDTEAAIIKPRLDIALARADVEITSSCFCRGQ